MNDLRYRLTPEIQREICAYIVAGGFGNVAAEAAGVPAKVFERWMKWGQAERPVAIYRDFYLAVRRAEGQARLAAESRTFQKAALSWLRSGPGRATAESAGWTNPVRPPALTVTPPTCAPEELFALGRKILEALEAFPEARVAVAKKLMEGGWDKDPAAEAMMEAQGQAEEMKSGEPRTENREPVAVADGGGECGAIDGRRTDGSGEPSYKGNGDRAAAVELCNEGAANLHRNRIEGALKEVDRRRIEAARKPRETDGEGASAKRKQGLSPWDSLDARHWVVGFG